MRLRHLIEAPKIQYADTDWRTGDMPPRACPIYPKSRPSRANWEWRSIRAKCAEREFVMVALVNPSRGDWKATLIAETENGHSVIARYEFHASHPGQHVHGDCEGGGVDVGPAGMDAGIRIPPSDKRHRRTAALTRTTFWQSARSFFRIEDDLGPLYAYHGNA